MDAIERYVLETGYDDLPPSAQSAARTFILDSLGVGLVGSTGPWVEELIDSQRLCGQGEDAQVWLRGDRLPAPAAAMCNAYQIHNSEFDCVHEAAVVHAVTVVLPSVLAVAECDGGAGGRELMLAVSLGVDVERVVAKVPSLVYHLVGRPVEDEMTVNYARLCAAYVAARALLGDGVGVEDFRADALRDPDSLALARRVDVMIDDNPDPNVLTPLMVEIVRRDGARHSLTLDDVYGSPGNPLSRQDHLAKFRRNCASAARPLPTEQVERLIAMADALEDVSELRDLVDQLVA